MMCNYDDVKKGSLNSGPHGSLDERLFKLVFQTRINRLYVAAHY
jgi:hypothetical protein